MSKPIKTMRDRNGYDVPMNRVSQFEKLCDRNVRRIHKRRVAARKMLEKMVAADIADIAEIRGAADRRGVKGNFQASSFDGLILVELRQQYVMTLDERAARARDLMLEYVTSVLDRATGTDTTVLRRLVEAAFRPNSKGFLPMSKIFELMRMEVKDGRWNEARGLLQDAIKPVKGRQYLSCATRTSTQSDWQMIKVDAADCWPEEAAEAARSDIAKEEKGGDEDAD